MRQGRCRLRQTAAAARAARPGSESDLSSQAADFRTPHRPVSPSALSGSRAIAHAKTVNRLRKFQSLARKTPLCLPDIAGTPKRREGLQNGVAKTNTKDALSHKSALCRHDDRSTFQALRTMLLTCLRGYHNLICRMSFV